mgnify:CR=1 FL=1
MSVIIFTYLPAIIGLSLLAIATYINNRSSKINRYFIILLTIIVLWLLFLMVADINYDNGSAIYYLRLAVAIGSFMGFVFLLFSDIFPASTVHGVSSQKFRVLGFLTLAFSILSLSPFLIPDISRSREGVDVEPVNGLYVLQSLFVISLIFCSLYILKQKFQSLNKSQKNQVRLLAAGAATATFLNLVSGLLLPSFKVSGIVTTFLTTMSLVLFAYMVFLAITRHGLFSLRQYTARAVAYLASLLILALTYSIFTLVVLRIEIDSVYLNILLVTGILMFGTYTFSRSNSYFIQQFTKLFYRESYVTHHRLEELNSKLVSTLDDRTIFLSSSTIIQDTLHSVKIYSVKINGKKKQLVSESTQNINKNKEVSRVINTLVSKGGITRRVNRINEVEQKMTLGSYGVELVVELSNNKNVLGYLVLTEKKSGEVYTAQDIEFLKTASKNISIALDNAQKVAKIQKFNKVLEDKIHVATRELRAQNREMQELAEIRNSLVDMATHQIKPKLTATRGFLELLKTEKHQSEKEEMIRLAESGITDVNDIVTSMLDSAHKITDSKLFLYKNSSVDIVELAVIETEKFYNESDINQIKISKRGLDYRYVSIDSVKVREVIHNLVSNAHAYGGRGGIEISINCTKTRVTLLVKDFGIGLKNEDIPKITQANFRSKEAKVIRPEGRGLGLHISRKIVEAHGGEFIIKKNQPEGAVFGFILPRLEEGSLSM